jgi:hypothetical protein
VVWYATEIQQKGFSCLHTTTHPENGELVGVISIWPSFKDYQAMKLTIVDFNAHWEERAWSVGFHKRLSCFTKKL